MWNRTVRCAQMRGIDFDQAAVPPAQIGRAVRMPRTAGGKA
jgi:hypothetical protein